MNFLVDLVDMQFFSIGYCYGGQTQNLLIADSMELPPGLDKILPSDVFKEIVALHNDKNLNGLEKRRRAEAIFRKVPKEMKDKMPLPPHFDRLPKDVKDRIKGIFFDDRLTFEEKSEKARLYIKSLPEDQKKAIRPTGFENLPEETQKQIRELMTMDGLQLEERFKRSREIISKVPVEIKVMVPGIDDWF